MLTDDGTMGEQESQLDIIIDSPWYTSWWAWVLYGLIVVLFILTWKYVPRVWDYLRSSFDRRKAQETQLEEAPSDEEIIEEAVLLSDDE